ncbi:GNAT family N-acetyltransferase [Amaricoccus sp.]|uniref:GNAT family N-acetyltransferase n=1 Tax=Amaricoccus sp. TaxID=1872485 RepID=UPI001B6BE955|nr:GNAT family N-acetyltransferase [Amaricoccus sp.]MBP7000301.1 GNAT family N-acetyltransferase [Amaricoccus sp.]
MTSTDPPGATPAAASVAIRPAAAADEPAIRACAAQAFARYVPLIGRRPAPMDANFAAQIAAGEIRVAADPAGALQGYVAFRAEPPAMLLDAVAVLPAAAGRGVGKALIAACEAAARRLALAEVRLYTNERMTSNLAMYPRLGYVETARHTEDGFSRVYFRKPLD